MDINEILTIARNSDSIIESTPLKELLKELKAGSDPKPSQDILKEIKKRK